MNKKKLIIIISILIILLFITSIYIVFFHNNKPIVKSMYETITEKLNKKESFNLVIEETNDEEINNILNMTRDFYDLKYIKTKVSDFSDNEYNALLKKLNLYDDKEYFTYPIFVNIKSGITSSYLVGFSYENDMKNYLFNYNIVENKYKGKDNYITDDEFKKISKTEDEILVLYGSNNDEFYNIRKKLIKENISYYLLNDGRASTLEIETLIMNELEDGKGPYLIKFKHGKIVKYLTDISIDNINDKVKEIK